MLLENGLAIFFVIIRKDGKYGEVYVFVMPFQIIKRIFLYPSLFGRDTYSIFRESINESFHHNSINTVAYRDVLNSNREESSRDY